MESLASPPLTTHHFCPRLVNHKCNERILKLWKSPRPFGSEIDETDFFTFFEGLSELPRSKLRGIQIL
jgi:hypothetical protein